MNIEEQEASVKAIRSKQLTWIYVFIAIDVFLLYYLYFSNGHINKSIIKFFIFTTSVCIFFQIKNLKENPDKYKYLYILKGDKDGAGFNQADRIANSIKNFSKVQFSRNTIGKAEEILNKSAIKKIDGGSVNYINVRDQYNQETRIQPERLDDENFKPVRFRTRTDRSVLDEISMDWPSKILNDRKQTQLRDYRLEQACRNPSTNINTSRNYSKTRSDYSNVKRNNSYLSRHESNKELKKTISRYSSKGKNTLQKSSVNTKSFYHNEVGLDLETVNERQKNFQALLANLHVDFRKYDFWVHHNIQVWLAFNFIPELVRRNHVS